MTKAQKIQLATGSLILFFGGISIVQADFPDVGDHMYKDAINYLQSEAVVEGYPDGNFLPNLTINRAEFTKIILEAQPYAFQIDRLANCQLNYGSDTIDCVVGSECEIINTRAHNACFDSSVGLDYPSNTNNASNYETCFSDVSHQNNWYAKYVCFAKIKGIIDGYPDGTFQAGNKIKLSEAAKIIVNAFGHTVQEETEVWYRPYIVKLEELKALPPSLSSFGQLITRGEMSEMAFRLMTDTQNKASTTYDNLVSGKIYNPEELKQVNLDQRDQLYAYDNSIINLQNRAMQAYHDYIDFSDENLAAGNYELVEQKHQETINTFIALNEEAKQLGSYNGDNAVITALKNDLIIKIMTFNDEGKAIIESNKALDELDENTSIEGVNAAIAQHNELIDEFVRKIMESNQELIKIYNLFRLKFELYNDASEYDEIISDIRGESIIRISYYLDEVESLSLQSNNLDEIENHRKETANLIRDDLEKLKSLSGYEGDLDYQMAVIQSLEIMLDLLEDEEAKYISLWEDAIVSGEITDNHLEVESDLVESVNQKLSKEFTEFNQARDAFAEAYNFVIEDEIAE